MDGQDVLGAAMTAYPAFARFLELDAAHVASGPIWNALAQVDAWREHSQVASKLAPELRALVRHAGDMDGLYASAVNELTQSRAEVERLRAALTDLLNVVLDGGAPEDWCNVAAAAKEALRSQAAGDGESGNG